MSIKEVSEKMTVDKKLELFDKIFDLQYKL